MIDKSELASIEEIVNQANPCKWCGKGHQVALYAHLSDCERINPIAKIFPTGDMIFLKFDVSSCENFKNNVVEFIESQTQKLIKPNEFDYE